MTRRVPRRRVLVQPEMEKRRSPFVNIPPLRGGDFQGIWGSIVRSP
jgi:hypothetical protein